MLRYATLTLLIAVGVMLAFNIGRSLSLLSIATTRNPATIAVTSFLAESGPSRLLALEQHVLRYLTLSPYAIALGLLGSLAFGPARAMAGVLLWTAFASTFTVLLCLEGARWDGLSWYSMLPHAIGAWCTVPIYVIGVSFGRSIRQRIWPRYSLIDLLIGATVVATISAAAFAPPGWLPPVVFWLASVILAWRLHGWRIPNAANHPMQPSGEVGRIEVDDQPSPPADR